MDKHRRLLSAGAVVIICAAATLWMFESDGSNPPAADRPAWVAVGRGRVDVAGGIVHLAAKRDGIVQEVLVEEGDRVKAKQLLAVLEDKQARLGASLAKAEYEAARAEAGPVRTRLAAARREQERLEKAVARDLATGQSLDSARDTVASLADELALIDSRAEVLRHKWQVAEHEVEQHAILAPSDGEIVRRDVRPGDGVSTLNVTPLFLFAPTRARVVRAEFEDRFIPQLHPGNRVQVTLESDDTRVFPGVLNRISPVVGLRSRGGEVGEKQDVRVVEAVVAIDVPELLIGQRVIVRVPRTETRP